MIFSYINWTVDPEIIRIGSFAIRYYGLFFALGFVFSYLIMKSFYKNEGIPLKELDLLTTVVVVGSLLGARLGHVIFYQPFYYLNNPLEILMIWQGGLASHGGAIGVILALWYYTFKTKRKPYLWILDRIAIPTALTGALIRLGNLMNSEIFGLETSLPWGVRFYKYIPNDGEAFDPAIPRHPTQIYEALAYLLIFIFLWFLYKRRKAKVSSGEIIGWFMILVFGFRFFIEFLKNNQVSFEESMQLNMGQWLSIPFVTGGLILLIRARKKMKHA